MTLVDDSNPAANHHALLFAFEADIVATLRGLPMIGLYLTSIFFGSLFAGRIGALYELLPPAQFWLVHAIAAALAGVLLLGLAGTFRRSFGPRPAWAT